MDNPKKNISKNGDKKNYNHLKDEKSPYLIQHAKNPVDWYPWGEEAFNKAKTEDKPIFLSIGYSTCHWCHVMAHESFEDYEVAELLNSVFVAVKVDREERPDIDSIYMTACQIMAGTGGWPLTIIMTPDKKPFFAGTYFPRESGFETIGLKDLILNVRDIWKDKREEIDSSGEQIITAMSELSKPGTKEDLNEDILNITYNELSNVFDEENGGFGDFTKFPTPHNFMFLLRYWKRTGNKNALHMIEKTLHSMAKGGIYDHLGFGFHRYSVDKNWLVPHFEKMLYDQALIAMAYTEVYQATGNSSYKKTAEDILKYAIRDMKSPKGAFYSAEDADSEGVEGKFYLWTKEEIFNVLEPDQAKLVSMLYDVKEDGNFNDPYSQNTNKNILHRKYKNKELADKLGLKKPELEKQIESARIKLYNSREKRIHPHKDDKILTDWNGLMIASLAKASQVFNNEVYSSAAMEAVSFIFENDYNNGCLLHRYRKGEANIKGNLDDYSFMIWGLLELYGAVFDIKYLNAAIELNQIIIEHFWDDENGGFYFTADDSEMVLMREKKTYDNATPSGNSIELMNLIKIARLTEDPLLEEMAVKTERSFSENVKRAPTAHTQFLAAVDYKLGPSFEVVVAGKSRTPDTDEMIRTINKHYIPNKVVIFKDTDKPIEVNKIATSLKYKGSINDRATAHICSSGSCKIPTNDISEMLKLLGIK